MSYRNLQLLLPCFVVYIPLKYYIKKTLQTQGFHTYVCLRAGEKGMEFNMNEIEGNIIGNISIKVCKTNLGKHFFLLQADNEDVLPMLDFVEDILKRY